MSIPLGGDNMSQIISIYGVTVKRLSKDLFQAYIKGEMTEGEGYLFTGTLDDVYEQICASKGIEL